jgi:hypothetical protein
MQAILTATVDEVATAAAEEVDNGWGGWQLCSVIYCSPIFFLTSTTTTTVSQDKHAVSSREAHTTNVVLVAVVDALLPALVSVLLSLLSPLLLLFPSPSSLLLPLFLPLLILADCCLCPLLPLSLLSLLLLLTPLPPLPPLLLPPQPLLLPWPLLPPLLSCHCGCCHRHNNQCHHSDQHHCPCQILLCHCGQHPHSPCHHHCHCHYYHYCHDIDSSKILPLLSKGGHHPMCSSSAKTKHVNKIFVRT